MADFDNGIPPEGTDISEDHIGSISFDSAEDYPEDTSHVGSVAYDTEESGDTPFTLQVLCDEAWVVADYPEWVWPDTLAGNGNGTIDFIVYKNTGHERTGKIVVQTADGMARAEHTVTQEAGGTVYIANIGITLAANPALTSGQLLLENVKVNRHDSENIDQIGPFNIKSGQSVGQQISYSSQEAKPDAITCTVWVANIVPVPANREVRILSGGVQVGIIITDVSGIGSMEMVIPIINTGLDNYTLALEVS